MKHVILIGVLGALALAGCASPYTPSPDRPFEEIPEFTSQASLSLVNAQPSTEEHNIGASILADYHAWTDVIIQIAERELAARGVRIDPQAERSLSLAITGVRHETGWVKIRTRIDLEAVTGDGYSAKYLGENSSAMMAVPKRQIDGAMMRAVKELLMDPEIVRYLTR